MVTSPHSQTVGRISVCHSAQPRRRFALVLGGALLCGGALLSGPAGAELLGSAPLRADDQRAPSESPLPKDGPAPRNEPAPNDEPADKDASADKDAPAAPATRQGLPGAAFGKVAQHRVWSRDEVRQRVDQWLADVGASDEIRQSTVALLEKEPAPQDGPEMLARICEAFALQHAEARQVLDHIRQGKRAQPGPDVAWLKAEAAHPLLGNNLRLYYGRWLCQEKLFDESRSLLEEIDVEHVVDPATLYFFQSVVYHRLLEKDAGLAAIEHLLQDVSDSPRRYLSLANLMQNDLSALKDDSLDHIARRMEDVERRLDLGRAGKRVRKIEDGIVESLDKMIEELEKQQQQQQQQQQAGGQMQPSQPAQQSRIMGGQGPGEVDPKKIAAKDTWGDLPPKKRQEALQQIPKNFPSHYRDVIEQYFRRAQETEPRR